MCKGWGHKEKYPGCRKERVVFLNQEVMLPVRLAGQSCDSGDRPSSPSEEMEIWVLFTAWKDGLEKLDAHRLLSLIPININCPGYSLTYLCTDFCLAGVISPLQTSLSYCLVSQHFLSDNQAVTWPGIRQCMYPTL